MVNAILESSPCGPRIFGMGHVLRYTPHNIQLRELLEHKIIGDMVSISHTEPVGHAHFAHSYVRGSWSGRTIVLSAYSRNAVTT